MMAPEAAHEMVALPLIDVDSFASLNPDRMDKIFLYDGENETGDKQKDSPRHYRYCLIVVDRDDWRKKKAEANAAAAVLIPAGRETEYVFSTRKGLLSVAESAQCARLIAVTLGRYHTFESQETIQAEVTPAIQILSQQGQFLHHMMAKPVAASLATSIPFMALGGIGSRRVIAEGESPTSGKYMVEQVDDDANDRLLRRLYFMDNPNVIQSEVAVLVPKEKKEHSGKKVDDAPDGSDIDRGYLAFEYHKRMAAGIISLTGEATASEEGLVIGLGGGGLLNFLQYAQPARQVAVVELDASVVEIAKSHFGFREDSAIVRVGNGLSIRGRSDRSPLADEDEHDEREDTKRSADFSETDFSGTIQFELRSLSFVAIDVDSKDKTVGMSCPPIEFVALPYLEELKSILMEDGVLAVNVAARDPEMLKLVKHRLCTVFSTVIESSCDDEEESLNVVLFAKPSAYRLSSITKLSLLDEIKSSRTQDQSTSTEGSSWTDTISDLEESIGEFKVVVADKIGTGTANKSTNRDNKNKKKGKGKGKKKGRRR